MARDKKSLKKSWALIQLSRILNYFVYVVEKPPFRTDGEIIKDFKEKFHTEIDAGTLNELLRKLVKDGFIYTEPRSDGVAKYYLTNDGRQFEIDGGYISKYRNDKLKKLTDRAVLILTLLIGLATVLTSYLQYKASIKNDRYDADYRELKLAYDEILFERKTWHAHYDSVMSEMRAENKRLMFEVGLNPDSIEVIYKRGLLEE